MNAPSKKFMASYARIQRISGFLFGICAFALPWFLVSMVKQPGVGRYIAILLAMVSGTIFALVNTWNPAHFWPVGDNQRVKAKKQIKAFTRIERIHPRLVSIVGCFVFNATIIIFFVILVPPVVKDAGLVLKHPAQLKWTNGHILNIGTVFGTSALKQSVYFETPDGQRMEGCLYYSLSKPLRVGDSFEFMMTPTANLILEVRRTTR